MNEFLANSSGVYGSAFQMAPSFYPASLDGEFLPLGLGLGVTDDFLDAPTEDLARAALDQRTQDERAISVPKAFTWLGMDNADEVFAEIRDRPTLGQMRDAFIASAAPALKQGFHDKVESMQRYRVRAPYWLQEIHSPFLSRTLQQRRDQGILASEDVANFALFMDEALRREVRQVSRMSADYDGFFLAEMARAGIVMVSAVAVLNLPASFPAWAPYAIYGGIVLILGGERP